jgi:hypothetical protein
MANSRLCDVVKPRDEAWQFDRVGDEYSKQQQQQLRIQENGRHKMEARLEAEMESVKYKWETLQRTHSYIPAAPPTKAADCATSRG